jgi:hypothetical protein
MRWPNVVNALLGVWFIIAPYALGFTGRPAATWSSVASGVVLFVLAGWAALSEGASKRVWPQYVNGLIGIWLMFSPFVFSAASAQLPTWINVAGGIIVAGTSGYLVFEVIPRTATPR